MLINRRQLSVNMKQEGRGQGTGTRKNPDTAKTSQNRPNKMMADLLYTYCNTLSC